MEDITDTVCIGNCMECNVERNIRKETYMFNTNQEENYFEYDEMNMSESSSLTTQFEYEI